MSEAFPFTAWVSTALIRRMIGAPYSLTSKQWCLANGNDGRAWGLSPPGGVGAGSLMACFGALAGERRARRCPAASRRALAREGPARTATAWPSRSGAQASRERAAAEAAAEAAAPPACRARPRAAAAAPRAGWGPSAGDRERGGEGKRG